MKLIWDEKAWEEYEYWQGQDKKTLKKINRLLKSIQRNGYDCEGKPERLKHDMCDLWSVEIDGFNRMMFFLNDDKTAINIVSCRGHYND